MTPRNIARAIGGRKVGRGWMARCPAHDDGTPSLSISTGDEGRILVRCHAGCPQDAVIDALKTRGLWPPDATADAKVPQQDDEKARRRRIEHEAKRQAEAAEKTRAAHNIFSRASSAKDSLVQIYLHARGIIIEPPLSLRYAPGLKHNPTGLYLPAMIAAVQDAVGHITGIQRTFLTTDGRRKAPVSQNKMMLGRCAGGAVRLALVKDALCVGEGVETMLSVQQETGRPCWAALSTSGLKALILPSNITQVTICADADDPGEQAAQFAAERWKGEGRKVKIARPTDGHKDFNDVLREGASRGIST